MNDVVCYAWKTDAMKVHAYEYTHRGCYEKRRGIIPESLLLWDMPDGSCWVLDSNGIKSGATCATCNKPLREDTNETKNN
jgi:hypothetical protein